MVATLTTLASALILGVLSLLLVAKAMEYVNVVHTVKRAPPRQYADVVRTPKHAPPLRPDEITWVIGDYPHEPGEA
jgi:hypothetical protein